MAEWYMQNYKIITVILSIACAAVLFFAIRVTVRHNRNYRSEEEKIKHLKAVKEKFSSLDVNVIENAENNELLEGVAMHYQLRLQKISDIEKEFSSLPVCARYVYTLDIFSSEGGVLSEFYKRNGNILRELFIPALKAVGEDRLAKIAAPLSRMYDPNDEMASIDKDIIERADEEFSQVYSKEELTLKAAEYIRKEAKNFV